MRQILKKIHVLLYLHSKSKHVFSVHQHIIMLVLRQYESKSYESFVQWLQVSTEITQMFGIKTIPHFTTLQKAAARLSNILLQLAGSSVLHVLEKYLQESMPLDLRTDITPHTRHIAVPSGTLTPKCRQVLT